LKGNPDVKAKLKFILGHLLCAICLSANAQSYSIDWYKTAGGGGTSANGNYSVSGTIGQHDAGQPMSGGPYSLTGGFWTVISVVPSPGAPTLTINRVNSTTVKVLWPYPSTGWTLQQSSDLTTASWSASSGVTHDSTNNFITLTSPAGNLFFRLKQ
jgi:hypothetical protein